MCLALPAYDSIFPMSDVWVIMDNTMPLKVLVASRAFQCLNVENAAHSILFVTRWAWCFFYYKSTMDRLSLLMGFSWVIYLRGCTISSNIMCSEPADTCESIFHTWNSSSINLLVLPECKNSHRRTTMCDLELHIHNRIQLLLGNGYHSDY